MEPGVVAPSGTAAAPPTVDAAADAGVTHSSGLWKLALGATGIVFGDIGTSPLYAFRESFVGEHKLPIDPFHVLGVLSMVFWALILVVTVKYVFITMRADNNGEGGSFALLALVQRLRPHSRVVGWIGMLALAATALLYGDAFITPAISILSAVEGMELIRPQLTEYVVPITLGLVVVLFAAQRFGTERIGKLFGPVMVLWFLVIGVLGAMQIARYPGVWHAIDPLYAARFLAEDPMRAFFTLGTMVLTITGAEALYADMGHFGRPAISQAWLWLVLPTLALSYAGQAALVLRDPAAIRSPFYLMGPDSLLAPLVLLATVATIIASQAVISGAFSISQQAMQLGYLPHLDIRHTSEHERGQVFAPSINWLLFVGVVALVLAFRSSSALAAAYGLAVTATMVLTTLMLGYVIFRIWKWPVWAAGPLYAVLLALDIGLFAASTTKFTDGGWLPTGVAVVLMLLFATWHRGRQLVAAAAGTDKLSIEQFLARTEGVYRAPGMAIYLTSLRDGLPFALLNNLKANKVRHERIVIATVETALKPYIEPDHRTTVTEVGGGITRVLIRYGFFEKPNIPQALGGAIAVDDAATYFLSRITPIPTLKPGMALWREHLFSAMVRNAEHPMTFFCLPIDRVVELGNQVEI